MKPRVMLLVAAVLGAFGLAAGAADWPQWRGPERNGISPETGLLPEWPRQGPRLRWQIKNLDYGYATPSVAGERIYLLSSRGMEAESVLALAVKDGSQVWSTRIGKVGKNYGMQYPGARSTPTVDGDVLYALGSDGDLVCLETGAGKERWHKNLRTDFGGKPGNWAYAESPLVDGDRLVCTPGGKEATLVALTKKTGDVIWKCAVPGGDAAGYASAVVAQAGGRKEYVQFLGNGLVGVDAETGKFLWRYTKTNGRMGMNIPTPVAEGAYVYSAQGRVGGGLVRLKPDKGGVEADQVYFERGLPNSMGGAVLVKGHLYGTTGQGLVCAEFVSGKVKWQDRCVGSGSICYADGRLYVHGDKNEVALVEATPHAYHEKGRFTLPDQPKHQRGAMEGAWCYPVVANGRLYIRDLGTLWCYDIRGADAKK